MKFLINARTFLTGRLAARVLSPSLIAGAVAAIDLVVLQLAKRANK